MRGVTAPLVALVAIASVGMVLVASVAGSPAVTEDSPGWDCLRQGNVSCRIDGVLVTSLEGLPDDPYDRCVFLLGISERVGSITYAPEVCDTAIWENRG